MLNIKISKTKLFLGIATVILSSFMLLASCTSKTGAITDEPEPAKTDNTTTAQTGLSVTPTDTPATSIITATTSVQTTTSASTTATTTIATTVEQEDIYKPVAGAEFAMIPLTYDKWTILEFDYDVIHEPGDDYRFPWSLTIKNKTETDLELTAYIIHWGFHGWVGYVSEAPFTLKAGETKSLSGEDILDEVFYEEMIYLEDVQIELYIAEG